MDSQQYMRMESEWSAPNYHPLPVVLAKGKGVWVWDVEGKRYMDFLSSYSAISQGHLHPQIVEAVRVQLDRLALTSRAFHNDRLGPFMQKLCMVSGMEMGLPMNTGAEAVETAIKVARRWSYEQRGLPRDKGEIIVCDNNFHGRTTTIVGFSSDAGSRDGFGPFTPGFVSVPFDDLDALEGAVGPNTIGILVEPIQAEAGIFVPRDGYLKGLRRVCDEHGILLMLDEIQTGLARTGRMFAFEHEGIRPDVLCVGKALGGGVMPVSAALSSRDIMSVMRPGSHGSTFGGNPLGCAIGEASIDVIVNERLADRAQQLGGHLMERLHAIKGRMVKQVRGRGLLVGVEMVLGQGETVRPHCERLLGLGLLCKDTHERTIRLAPPLTITREELDWALERLAKVIA
jgi:ornithine--oxo-acid transaminase